MRSAVNTLGLVDSGLRTSCSRRPRWARVAYPRIAAVSVSTRRDEPAIPVLQPVEGRGFADARLVSRATAADVNVEVTAVDRPDVDVREVEALALRLGAQASAPGTGDR